MEKAGMRDWVARLEALIDRKLKKWMKENPISNGEVVQLRWTFEQTHIHLDIFWLDGQETVSLHYLSPRGNHDFLWHGLTDKSIGKIEDRIGNLAQITMHPPVEPPPFDGRPPR